MLDSDESGFEFEVEMITTCLRAGWPLAWVPIRTIYGAPSHIRPIHHLRHFLRATRAARQAMRAGDAGPAAEAGGARDSARRSPGER
jgi:hypothetical protein